IFVEELDAIDVEHIGRYFSSAPIFPQQINVDFVERYTPRFVRIKTWERGAGHTLSCGTGCCAAVAAGQKRGLLESRVHVETEGGVMTVWRGDDDLLYLCGAAEWVCRGTLSSELLAGVWKRE
ncbi:MAG: diaminopimelate epimerase, partial [Pygmaiobacter sp.]